MLTNQIKIALSTILKFPVLSFCRVMLLSCSNECKSFYFFLTQVDRVFFGTPYLVAAFLLLIPFSKSLRPLYFSRNTLRFYLRFPATNMFQCEQQTKNKQMIVCSNVRIHNINKIERSNV